MQRHPRVVGSPYFDHYDMQVTDYDTCRLFTTADGNEFSECDFRTELIEVPYVQMRTNLHLSGLPPVGDYTLNRRASGEEVPIFLSATGQGPSNAELQDRFTFTPHLGLLAISIDDTRVNGIDLHLDSPIATAEWLRSPFFFD
ncbi:MAG: hypothetical protein SGJ24_14005 [Chloroflexota bacterium]|nr:hypothetical protein [Chloroflexota bacterium]